MSSKSTVEHPPISTRRTMRAGTVHRSKRQAIAASSMGSIIENAGAVASPARMTHEP